ncbi:MAG: hypothetical protein QOH31_3055, partial [Verrucomicrobiota bacterium]
MRKKLLLLLAALSVAIIPGRETSALSASPTNCEASVLRWKPLINVYGMSTDPVDSYAFGMPTHPVNSYAFGMPTHPVNSYVFGMPTHPVNSYAFGMPTHPVDSYAFGMPTHPVSGYVEMGKAGLRIVMLPLGAEAGRHIRPENSESEKSAKDLELSNSKVSNPLAMLPLGRESGRHIRTENVRDVDSEAAKHQSATPVAEL